MASSSAHRSIIIFFYNQTPKSLSFHLGFPLQNSQKFLSPVSLSLSSLPLFSRRSLQISAVGKSIPLIEAEEGDDVTSIANYSSWSEFANKASGEWDGFGADFTAEGRPIELPESVVPEAYREWDVKVFDWQTQCPTLADRKSLDLSYRVIKLLPTVGCEADAATIYNTDERNIGGIRNKVSAFAYHCSGSYVALWTVNYGESYKLWELEHCLMDPRNRESRVRVVQVVQVQKTRFELQSIRVFCEQWYGPFRNGDQLGGCAIQDSGFASTEAMNVLDVAGSWDCHDAVANFQSSQNGALQKLKEGNKRKAVRDGNALVGLPRKLWCSLRETENGETWGEAGWLLGQGLAISSRCIFSSDGNLKEMAVAHETAAAAHSL